MIRWLIRSSLKFRFLVVAIAAAMMIFGITQIPNLPLDVFPEFAPPYVEIQTEAFGLSTIETEELVTVNMEEWLTGTGMLKSIRSKSVSGLSSVVVTFQPGTEMMLVRQYISERLTTLVGLPNVSKTPVMLQPLSATSRTMKIGLSSTNLSLMELSSVAFWKIRPRLMVEPGVANVAIWGQRQRQLQVQVNPKLLLAHDITLSEVVKTTGEALWTSPLGFLKASTVGTGGWIDTPNQRLGNRHVLPISTPDDLAKVTVKVIDGVPVRLGDLGLVVEGHLPLIGDAVLDDGPGLILVIEKFSWANALQVTEGIEAALEELRPGLPGIEMDSRIFRTATFIEMSIDNLTKALLIGCFFVVLILFAFLYQWRVALISLIAIPLSLLAALLVFYLRGDTINTMVLAGLVIALGAVVDDAIIDIENIVRRLREHRKEGSVKSTARIILEASLEVRSAIVYATLIIVLAVSPVFFLEGISGAFFQPLAFSYVLALLASMVIALTVTPALSLILLRNAKSRTEGSPLVRWLQHAYNAVLSRIIRRPRKVLITAVVIALAGLAVWPWLGQELLPAFKERDLMVHWVTKPGTSHPEMIRIVTRASRELRSVSGVRDVSGHMGRALMGDQIVSINSGELWISVDLTADYEATVASIREVVDGYPGVFSEVLTYLKERTRVVLSGASEAIVVRLFGPELDVLQREGEVVRQVISEIDGIVDLKVGLSVAEPHLEIEVDLAAAELYGLTPGDVRRSASTFIAGIVVGSFFEAQRVYDVVVWGTPDTRNSLSDIRNLLIDTPIGGNVRLEEVADVRIAANPTVIRRDVNSRYIDIVANVRGRDLGSVVTDVERRIQEVEFPLEYHTELLGEYTELQSAQKSMLIYFLAAMIGIFLLLQASFGSWRLATVSFLTLPMALVGGVLVTFAVGGIISLGSLVGFLTVLGIAARNSIMLINHYQHLEQHEGETFGPGLVLRGARERLAPILMTALTTGMALLPLVVAGHIPGHEIEHPMAVVILGGLVTSTLLNLFVLPSLYLRFRANPEPEMNETQLSTV